MIWCHNCLWSTKQAKGCEKFQSKTTEYLLISSSPTSFRVLRVFRGLKNCEAENSSNCLEVDRTWVRILCSHVLRTFAGLSDSFSNKSADRCWWRRSENDSVRKRRSGNLDGAVTTRTSTGPRRRFHFALLRQCGSRRSLACLGGRDVERSRSGDLGNELSWLWR